MLHVQYIKPFVTNVNVDSNKIHLIFAYQYFLIMKDKEVFHFIPIEGKEIIVNLSTMQVENLSEVFVFQRGNRFIRMSLYQLMLISNLSENIMTIVDAAREEFTEIKKMEVEVEVVDENVLHLIKQLEKQNLLNEIDKALDLKDKIKFNELTYLLNY